MYCLCVAADAKLPERAAARARPPLPALTAAGARGGGAAARDLRPGSVSAGVLTRLLCLPGRRWNLNVKLVRARLVWSGFWPELWAALGVPEPWMQVKCKSNVQ